jgi:alpha-beta hydrolase superfamily lysophospholipase
MIKTTGTFLSSSRKDTITYYMYTPKGTVRALVQISHGMCEYIERYEPFIEWLCGQGFLVFGNDHLGHGASADGEEGLGYFAKKDGWKCLVKDLHRMTQIAAAQYPDRKIFLFGHSMGSFVARAYVAQYADEIDGAIFCGSAGPNPLLPTAKRITAMTKALRGEFYRSPGLDRLMFGNYNKKYKKIRTAVDWLTRDEEIVDRYLKDPYCRFTFTASGFYDLVCLLEYVTDPRWAAKVPAKLPIYMIAGDMDPVGNFGKGIRATDEALRKTQRADYEMKLYKGMRHEILNEIGKQEVWDDILQWLEKHIEVQGEC